MDSLEKLRQQFEGHMRAHGAMVFSLATRLMGDPVEGAKLTEVTFLAAYIQLDQLKDEDQMGEWFYRLCIRAWKEKTLETKKQYSRFKIYASPSHKEGGPESEIPGLDAPLMVVWEGEGRQKALKHALSQLGPEERALIVLRDIDDKSYEEISELLEIPLDTMTTRIARVRDHVRQILIPIISKVL
jgi:RNA polymerase sigma-70 factor, ECF subfamily